MRYLFLLLALWLPLSLQAAEKISVVTSFSILADMTREVGGEHIELTNLVGPDADAHLYEPSPDDAQALLRADLIIANGLGFEGWMQRLLKTAGYKGQAVVVSQDGSPDAPDFDQTVESVARFAGGLRAAQPVWAGAEPWAERGSLRVRAPPGGAARRAAWASQLCGSRLALPVLRGSAQAVQGAGRQPGPVRRGGPWTAARSGYPSDFQTRSGPGGQRCG